jgi:hypothetical protein
LGFLCFRWRLGVSHAGDTSHCILILLRSYAQLEEFKKKKASAQLNKKKATAATTPEPSPFPTPTKAAPPHDVAAQEFSTPGQVWLVIFDAVLLHFGWQGVEMCTLVLERNGYNTSLS